LSQLILFSLTLTRLNSKAVSEIDSLFYLTIPAKKIIGRRYFAKYTS